jgi:hypothetical protein
MGLETSSKRGGEDVAGVVAERSLKRGGEDVLEAEILR